jgi:CelD/BcsL family acetyltransferase involved in cellulose biosynthesis
MFVLFIDKKPLAFINSTQGMDTRYGTHMGFDPEFSKLPLGTIILFEKIRHLISTGKNQVYDFGIGGAEYKNRLCSKMSMAQMRMIRTRGALSNPAYLYMSLLNRTSNGIKRLLKRAGMENASRSRIRSLRKKVK